MFNVAASLAVLTAEVEGAIKRSDFKTARLAVFDDWTQANAREEGGQFAELLAFPLVAGMIVALGALDLNTQENARDFGDCFFGFRLLGQNQTIAAIFGHVAGGGE